ncbi:MAG: AtpZ/AtpI family protein [Ignavibacteriales bacterium]|nr:AtpZ/AtpI family protein [Ignavibacteriales bacterium]
MRRKNLKLNDSNLIKNIAPYLNIGTQLAITIALSFFLGKWLDDILNIFPVLTIFLSLLGIITGLYNFIKTIIEIEKRKSKEN